MPRARDNRIGDSFVSFGRKLEGASLEAALKDAAEEIAKEAESRAARGKTGNLKKGIRVERTTSESGLAVSQVLAGGKWQPGFYAHMVERGTRHSRAQPFMRPALKRGEQVAPRSVARSLKRLLRLR